MENTRFEVCARLPIFKRDSLYGKGLEAVSNRGAKGRKLCYNDGAIYCPVEVSPIPLRRRFKHIFDRLTKVDAKSIIITFLLFYIWRREQGYTTMGFNLKNRHLLKLADSTPQEIAFLVQLAAELKAARNAGAEVPRLQGKNIALIFEKDSTRTRVAFEVAAYEQGARVTYLGPSGSHIGVRESMKDTARVLGRVFDAIEYRGFKQATVEELAQYAGVPVWNGLTAEAHPTQGLADLLTMQEHTKKPLEKVSCCFLGYSDVNVAQSLLLGAVKMGIDFRLAGPREHWPDAEATALARGVAQETGARLTITEDADAAVKGCDFLYTDTWVAVGEPVDLWGERIKQMLPYQVNSRLMALTGNPHTRFMHCLPAFHNTETKIGKEIYEQYGLEGLEVTEEVFESAASIVFDQAENRLHTIKAVMVATLA